MWLSAKNQEISFVCEAMFKTEVPFTNRPDKCKDVKLE